jgi:hypothetical protein
MDMALATAEGHLLIEVSAQSLNYILYKKDPSELLMIRQYRLYTSADRSARDVIDEIIDGDPLLQQHAGKALVVYNFPESNIIPSKYSANEFNTALTRLIYGEAVNGFIFSEEIRDADLHNVYRIPKDIHVLLKEKFAGSRYWHFYTLMVLVHQALPAEANHFIKAVFYNDKFICSFYSAGRLQIIQTFTYQTPEDVAYYLLMLCKQFGVRPPDIFLSVSGLIDSQSALYTELLKYFPEVAEEGLPGQMQVNRLLEEFPAHYFSPLLNMSLCGL